MYISRFHSTFLEFGRACWKRFLSHFVAWRYVIYHSSHRNTISQREISCKICENISCHRIFQCYCTYFAQKISLWQMYNNIVLASIPNGNTLTKIYYKQMSIFVFSSNIIFHKQQYIYIQHSFICSKKIIWKKLQSCFLTGLVLVVEQFLIQVPSEVRNTCWTVHQKLLYS